MIDENFGLRDDASLVLPRGKKGKLPFVLDMTAILEAERRIPEMQRSNPLTFPELSTIYNIGICTLTKCIAKVQVECLEAKRQLDETKALFRLDMAEAILAQKKIKSSVDARDDASKLDPNVQEAQAKYDFLSTIEQYLQNKHKDLERVYYGAKYVADLHSNTPNNTNYTGHNN